MTPGMSILLPCLAVGSAGSAFFAADILSAVALWGLACVWGWSALGLLRVSLSGRAIQLVVYSGLLGTALVAWVGLLLSLLNVPLRSPVAIAVCLLGACLTVGMSLWTGHWERPSSRKPTFSFEAMISSLVALALLPTIVFLFVDAATLPFHNIDAVAIWSLKGKLLYHQTLVDNSLLRDPAASYSHADYPLLVPFNVGFLWSLRGGDYDGAARFWHVGLALMFIGLIYETARRKLSRLPSVLLTVLTCTTTTFAFQSSAGIADIALAALYLASSAALVDWLADGQTSQLSLCGLYTAGMAFTKNEGLALAAVHSAIVFGALLLQRGTWRAAVTWLAWATLPNLAWFAVLRDLPQTHENYAGRFSLELLARGSARLPLIAETFCRESVVLEATHGLWVLTPVLGLMGFWTSQRFSVVLAWLLLLGHLAAYIAALMVTPWELAELLAAKAQPLLLTASPAALLLIIEAYAAICPREPIARERAWA